MSFDAAPLPRVPVIAGRHPWIVQRCAGKRVLHLGCVDSGLLEERLRSGTLLHPKIEAVAEHQLGVDIDAEGIERLREAGFDDLLVADVTAPDTLELLREQHFDVIVASEVVEHLDNPGNFLTSVAKLMRPDAELLVTVPNAFSIKVLTRMLRGVEEVHPDHNYWFSYRTARRLLEQAGLEVRESAVYTFESRLLPQRLAKLLGAETTVVPPSPTSASAATSSPGAPPSLLERGAAFLKTFPRRSVVSALYRQTPFFADGLVFVAGPRVNDLPRLKH